MSILAALGGLLLPEVTKLADRWMSMREAKAAHERQKELLVLAHNKEIDINDVKAFSKAQMELSGGMVVPASGDSWKQWVPAWVAVGINALIHSVRPVVTYAAIPVLIYVLASTSGPKRDDLLDEIVFTCVACLRYWFGYREEMRRKNIK